MRDLTEGTGRGAKCSFDIWLSEDYLMPGGSCLPFLEPMVQKERHTIFSFKCTYDCSKEFRLKEMMSQTVGGLLLP